MNRADIVAQLKQPAIVLAVFFLMLMAARGATPQPAAPNLPMESGWVQQLPAQIWQFLLDTPHRAKDSVWKQLGVAALFAIFVTFILFLAGAGFGSQSRLAVFGGLIGGALMVVIICYGGFAPFVLIPWGIFIFVKGFKSGRRSPEKYRLTIGDPSESVPAETSPRPPMTAIDWLRPSVIALVVSNLVPVFGVLALGWSVFPVLMLYWLENVVIGFYNVLRMAWCADEASGRLGLKLVFIPFFCVHYGGFCAAHGFFVLGLFGGKALNDPALWTPGLIWQTIVHYQLHWAWLGLGISHGVSFVTNYLRQGEYRHTDLTLLMFQPYVRVVVLHVAVIIGGGVLLSIGAPEYSLLLLLLMKIILDLRAHLAERAKLATRSDESHGPADMITNLLGRHRKR